MDAQDIGLKHLKALSLMLESGSLTRTAQLLETSQPSLSKMLRRLRVHFGDPLLVRQGAAMVPTPKALLLQEPLKALLTTSQSLQAAARSFDPALTARQFSILLTDVGMLTFVPPLLRRLAAAGPRLSLRAAPLDARGFEARLESGEVDLAVGAFPDPPAGLRRQRLYLDGYAGAVRAERADLPNLLSSEGFLAARHAVVVASATGHSAHQRLERALTAALPEDKIAVRAPSFVAAAFIAAETDVVATLPSRLAEMLAPRLGLKSFPSPLALPPIAIEQYWHERMQADEGHRWLRAAVFAEFASASAAAAVGMNNGDEA